MIYIQAGIDAPSTRADIYYTSPTLESFFTALPTIMFAFGGASTFPTIQNDMINKSEFVKSVGIAFVGRYRHLWLPNNYYRTHWLECSSHYTDYF